MLMQLLAGLVDVPTAQSVLIFRLLSPQDADLVSIYLGSCFNCGVDGFSVGLHHQAR